MIKAIVFDFFGVIYPETLSLVSRPHLQVDDPRREDLRQLRRQSDLGMMTRDQFWDQAATIMQISRQQLDSELNKIRDADWELLEYIKSLRQHYQTALISNVGHGFLEQLFDGAHPKHDYFDELILSSDVGVLKPDPEIYKIALERLHVQPEEAIFTDDRQMHCDGAKKTGMHTILYEDFMQFKTELNQLLNTNN